MMLARLRTTGSEVGQFAKAIIAAVIVAVLALVLAIAFYLIGGSGLPDKLIGPFGVITGASSEAPLLLKKELRVDFYRNSARYVAVAFRNEKLTVLFDEVVDFFGHFYILLAVVFEFLDFSGPIQIRGAYSIATFIYF